MGFILNGDALEQLKTLPDNSINCCITSPPYYGLRDYGTGEWVGGDPNCKHGKTWRRQTFHQDYKNSKEDIHEDIMYKKVCPICGAVRVDKQIGIEETPEEYIKNLVNVFHEVKRVLTDDGTLWVNIGDSYNSGPTGSVHSDKQKTNEGSLAMTYTKNLVKTCKPKDLIGIPWMLAFALREDGWYLRQDIIWAKPNPMPESVTDRCTKSHEYIFLFSKSPKYYFNSDAIREPAVTNSKHNKHIPDYTNSKCESFDYETDDVMKNFNGTRNKRDVWSIPVAVNPEAHFAVFPKSLIEPCILAGCPEGGVVLDPFFGSGTTGVVAVSLGRDYAGVELNPKYVDIAQRRINEEILGVNIERECESEEPFKWWWED